MGPSDVFISLFSMEQNINNSLVLDYNWLNLNDCDDLLNQGLMKTRKVVQNNFTFHPFSYDDPTF